MDKFTKEERLKIKGLMEGRERPSENKKLLVRVLKADDETLFKILQEESEEENAKSEKGL